MMEPPDKDSIAKCPILCYTKDGGLRDRALLMESILELLQFRSAAPFAYLGFCCVSVSAVAAGTVLIVQGLRKRPRSRWRIAVGAIVLCGMAVQFTANLVFDSMIEFNPSPINKQDLEGLWFDGGTSLQLNADGTFDLKAKEPLAARIGATQATGTWSIGDWNLRLETASGTSLTPLRVIQFGKTYRLIIEDYGDPDCWDGRLGFGRQ